VKYNPLAFSPLPVVDLASLEPPRDGAFMPLSNFCQRKFKETETCREFYKSLRDRPSNGSAPIQCPFGFGCYRFDLAGKRVAFCGFVPFPRLGGEKERERAKHYPQSKIEVSRVLRFAQTMQSAEKARIDSIIDALKTYPAALHEVRKYNRTVKQEAERLCLQQSPTDPDHAEEALVRIWKSSELMTYQFEILDLIANETLAKLPRKTDSEVYKIFHKCVRIYEVTAAARRIRLSIAGDSPRSLVCDKTFPIIPTVLLENAIRYSIQNTEVNVRVKRVPGDRCTISVSSLAPFKESVPDVFAKGVSGIQDDSGLGVGLFLAQQVARQHGAEIRLDRHRIGETTDNWVFSFELATL
jgi:signal transduction histidine kinase